MGEGDSGPLVTVERQDSVAIVRLNRPEVRNALNVATWAMPCPMTPAPTTPTQ